MIEKNKKLIHNYDNNNEPKLLNNNISFKPNNINEKNHL